MDLAEALRCNGHHVLVQNVDEVMGRHGADIHSSLKETVIKGRVTSVDHHIVIIAKSLSTIEIKDHIAISVLKEVALRLLQVNEAQRLLHIKNPISYKGISSRSILTEVNVPTPPAVCRASAAAGPGKCVRIMGFV